MEIKSHPNSQHIAIYIIAGEAINFIVVDESVYSSYIKSNLFIEKMLNSYSQIETRSFKILNGSFKTVGP